MFIPIFQAIEGIYRNGKKELLEEPTASEGMRVIVTFLDSPAEPVVASDLSANLEARGIGIEQVADLRSRLKTFAENWDSPEMDGYDEL